MFAIVPIVLSLFGFIAAAPSFSAAVGPGDPQLVSIRVVQHFLPGWTLLGFSVMALCGLSSTLDSAYCAAGSLFSVDIYRRYVNPGATDQQMLRASKLGMLSIGILGTIIALLPGISLIWLMMIYGTFAGSAVSPALMAIYWKDVTARAVTWGVASALIFGFPLSVYANLSDSPRLLVLSVVGTTIVGFVMTFVVGKFGTRPDTAIFQAEEYLASQNLT